jgi:hypothetical protein
MPSPAIDAYSKRKAPREYDAAFLDKEFATVQRAVATVQFPQSRTISDLGSDNPVAMYHPIVVVNPTANVTVTIEAAAFEVYTAATNAKTFTELEGGVFYAEHDGSGAMTNLVGGFIGATHGGSGTVTLLLGLEVEVTKTAGGTVTTATGLLVDDVTAGTTNIALQTGLGRVQFGDVVELRGAATARSGSIVGIGGTTQTTIGANGAASALTANPLGYLIFFKGATKIVVPYYNG